MSEAIVCTGQLFKLPTWARGSPQLQEKQFRLRYFTLTKSGKLSYYSSATSFQQGKAALGSVQVGAKLIVFERVNKLDFVLTNDTKRLWLRAMAEPEANKWEAALERIGVAHVEYL